MKRRMNRILALLLCLGVLVGLCGSAMALEPVDTTKNGSIQLYFAPEGEPAEGTEFRVYKIADLTAQCQFVPASAFAAVSNISEVEKSSPDYEALTDTVDAFVRSNETLAPDFTGEVGSDGYLTITNVPVGLYFVCGDRCTRLNRTFCPVSFLVSVPANVTESETYEYGADVDYQYIEDVESATSKAFVKSYTAFDSVKVILEWKDIAKNNHLNHKIRIKLFGDGKLYEDIELTAENSWTWEWPELPPRDQWSIEVSGLPEGYTIEEYDEPGLFRLVCDIQPVEVTPTPTPAPTPAPVLPQTGLTWWPVPVLVVLGLAMVTLGFAARQKKRESK